MRPCWDQRQRRELQPVAALITHTEGAGGAEETPVWLEDCGPRILQVLLVLF